MNILFHTYGKVNATKGGTERVTISVATGLTRYYGCRCFSLYEAPADTAKEDCFVDEFHWIVKRNWNENIAWLHNKIIAEKIDVVIIQGSFIYVKYFKQAAEGTGCKIVFAHHFEPGWEAVFFKFKQQITNLVKMQSLRSRCRCLKNIVLFPYQRRKYLKSLHSVYREAYCYADRVVLICKGFIKQYQSFGNFDDADNFSIIPNSLSFNEFISQEKLSQKEDIALIVARLDEPSKKISLAIKIWGEIKKSPIAKNWKLKIVGEGNDLSLYQSIVKKNHIPDITFEGRKNPIPYYTEAKIFLMTSKSESWGLTLTEAQQFGVVPIAFNTYASLTDIITDGEDGVVIPPGEIDKYVTCLLELMQNEEKRNRLASQGLTNCKRFSQEIIAGRWWELLNSLYR